MPKLGMEPIRREQICRAAATVIAREGFAGTTLRKVADEAGVSTGMLNHYFTNRQDLLTQTLIFVSERTQTRTREAMEGIPAGWDRLYAMLDTALEDEVDRNEGWRVWINAYGEAVHLPELRRTIESRLQSWYPVIDHALEGLVPPEPPGSIPWSWRLDAILNGLAIQALASEAPLAPRKVRDEVVRMLLPGATESPDGSGGIAAPGRA
jgi:TetR/AcrR family transcriptional regulator, transcriptional repressor of bet genes